MLPSFADWSRSKWAIARGTAILVGVLPGAGPTVAAFMAYTVEKRLAKEPRSSAREIGALLDPNQRTTPRRPRRWCPMLTLGIPGSATTAIMLGGLMMWGLRPGPMLFEKNPQFVWGLIASQYIANVLLLILSTLFIPLSCERCAFPIRS